MNTYTSGTSRPSAALALAMTVSAMFTTWMLNQPDMLGQATQDGKPIAAISDVGQTVAGQNLSLDATASYDPLNSSSSLSYAWNFGDGTTTTGIAVNHVYHNTGNYIITLTVTSPEGSRIIQKNISVGDGPNYYSNPYSPLGGVNHYNPAVSIASPNNNLPQQPFVQSPQLATPTHTATSVAATTPTNTPVAVVTNPKPAASQTFNPLPLLLLIACVILIIGGVVLCIFAFRPARR